MKKKVLTAAAAIIVATSAFGSTGGASDQNPASIQSVTTTTIPNDQKIIADLIGHHMYVSETVPGLWEFSAPANIHLGNIGSTRLNGNMLEYNFTMILVDQKAPNKDAYKAETLISYQLIDNTWQLQTIREVSFKTAGTLESLQSGEC